MPRPLARGTPSGKFIFLTAYTGSTDRFAAVTRRTPCVSKSPGLLTQPARTGARTLARARLDRAMEKAAPLLAAPPDDLAATIGNEEVHDFRVAVRRLRSWIRASGALVRDDLPRTERATLRRIAQCAGVARDAQVQWLWLAAPDAPFSAPAARAAHWLAKERLASYVTARGRLQKRAASLWPPLAATLARALRSDDAHPAVGGEASLADALAPTVERHVAVARRALDRIEHRTQVATIHRARIKVKRLRYLLEAIDAPSRAAIHIVRQLRALQDVLGALHDAHVMEEHLAPLLTPRLRNSGRPALRDLRALRAALRRRELAAFRQSLDLADALSTSALWRDPVRGARTLLRAASSRQLAPLAADAPRNVAQPTHAPPDRRG